MCITNFLSVMQFLSIGGSDLTVAYMIVCSPTTTLLLIFLKHHFQLPFLPRLFIHQLLFHTSLIFQDPPQADHCLCLQYNFLLLCGASVVTVSQTQYAHFFVERFISLFSFALNPQEPYLHVYESYHFLIPSSILISNTQRELWLTTLAIITFSSVSK